MLYMYDQYRLFEIQFDLLPVRDNLLLGDFAVQNQPKALLTIKFT